MKQSASNRQQKQTPYPFPYPFPKGLSCGPGGSGGVWGGETHSEDRMTAPTAEDQRILEQRRAARQTQAYNDVRDRLPDLHDGRPGHPCPWAVWALLRVRGPGREVTAHQIRRERAALLRVHAARWGDPYEGAPADHPATKADGRADSIADPPVVTVA